MFNINARIKRVSVSFDPNVVTTHFNQQAFNCIQNQGLELTDLSLIHYASIHYQSRFKNSVSRRFKHTLDTIEPSLTNINAGGFYFSNYEDSELQKMSSEVIGVGFAMALSHRLLGIPCNRMKRINPLGMRKRCDYEALKDGNRIIIEAKGTKGNVNGARNKITAQKGSYPADCAKYGVISHIPRDHRPTSLTVVDPDAEFWQVSRDYQILSLLDHYSRVARLAGFYRLSEKLNERIDSIISGNTNTASLQGRKLEFGNVRKLGVSLGVVLNNQRFITFFAPDWNTGLKIQRQNKEVLFFGVDARAVDILEEQDFDQLLDYSFENSITDRYSTLDDGTFLGIADKDKIERTIKN